MGTIQFLNNLEPELQVLKLNLRNADKPAAFATLQRLQGLAVQDPQSSGASIFTFTPEDLVDVSIRTSMLGLTLHLIDLANLLYPPPTPETKNNNPNPADQISNPNGKDQTMCTTAFFAQLKPELVQLELQLRNGDRPASFSTLQRLEALALHEHAEREISFFAFRPDQLEDPPTATAILLLVKSMISIADLYRPDPAPDPKA